MFFIHKLKKKNRITEDSEQESFEKVWEITNVVLSLSSSYITRDVMEYEYIQKWSVCPKQIQSQAFYSFNAC